VPVFPASFWDDVDALEAEGKDFPEYYITAQYDGFIEAALAWGRLMACNPNMVLQIAVEYLPADYNQPTDDPFDRSELIAPLGRRFIGFFEDSAGDVCLAMQLLFAPEHDTASGVYFLYAADYINDLADFNPVVTPDATHGIQWRYSGDGRAAGPADFYLMDREWTWMPRMPAMPMPPLRG
jgi:hypothetical protein